MKFFPGCMIHNRYFGIEKSIYYIFEKLEEDIEPLYNFSCCPAPGITKSISDKLWFEIAKRNLNLSDDDIITACNGCFTTLSEVGSTMGREVRHVIEYLYTDKIKEIKRKIAKRIPLRVAVHYGCHFFRPSIHKKFVSSEKPKILDKLVKVIGSESVDYRYKFMCCGGGGGVRASSLEVARELLEMKLRGIKERNVDAIVVICPLCLHQFDVGQKELNQLGKRYEIPTIHYVQLLAIAMGMDIEESGIDMHEITPPQFMEKLIRGESFEEL